ncbi:MAG: HPr family phosphocarrier protein [Lachnospiraceae bacterium]|nr:HPr family phosphocarrier protein [Lachnospiraceae bacterium]MBP5254534.1 HPr family phosphocarrier protein [Lachnospiraceae bacterium]
MVQQTVKLNSAMGIIVDSAGILCKEAMNYRSSISFTCRNTTVNVKSILSVLAAGVRNGDEMTFVCSGPDEEEALARMVYLAGNGFDTV